MDNSKVSKDERLALIEKMIEGVRADIETDTARAEAAATREAAYRMQDLSEDYFRLADLLDARCKLLGNTGKQEFGDAILLIAITA